MQQVLIVGAGAVGQVFGRHLQLGGAEVSFLVRPQYAEQVRRGFTLYPLNQSPRWRPQRLKGCAVISAAEQVGRPDCVVLCVSSTALRRGAWLSELGAAAGQATIVTLQPGLEDRSWIIEQLDGGAPSAGGSAGRLVSGMIGFMSYTAHDADGVTLDAPGVAYWVPPLTALPFSGPAPRVSPFIDGLRRGGLPANQRADVQAQVAFTGPVLQMQIVALECAGWSFAELRRQPALRQLAFAATREAVRIAEAHLGRRAPATLRVLRPWMVSAGLGLTRWIAPFDLEPFFRLHFTKVADQTRHELASLLRLARQLDVDASAVQALADRLSADGAT